MRISTVKCSKCGAIYDRAEAEAAIALAVPARYLSCSICETPLETGDPSRVLAYRMVIPPDPPFPF